MAVMARHRACSRASAAHPPRLAYEPGQADTLVRILRRDRVLGEDEELPPPDFRGTGVRKGSHIYFIRLPQGLHLVAKFDDPGRAKREWAVIQELVREAVPLEILPANYHHPDDGVIWYRNALQSGQVDAQCQLEEMVERQLASSPDNCARAVAMGFEALYSIHRPAALDEPTKLNQKTGAKERLAWEDLFPKLAEDGAWNRIKQNAQAAWPTAQAALATVAERRGEQCSALPGLDAILAELEKLSATPVPSVAVARIHGDANLTNLVVGLGPDRTALKTLVIDWADSQRDRAAVVDFARAETWFWHGPFLKALAQAAPTADPCTTFAAVRGVLDGRSRALPREAPPLAAESLEFVLAIRQKSLAVLKRDREDYLLNDLYHALAFSHLQALLWAGPQEAPAVARMALLGAALAWQVLTDIDAGKYAKDSPGACRSPAEVASLETSGNAATDRGTIEQSGSGGQAVGCGNVVSGKKGLAVGGDFHGNVTIH
jgi:hypothetical protein